MNKPLSSEELASLSVPGPVATAPMTRREKLERWASALERYPHIVVMATRLEYCSPARRAMLSWRNSPFAVACGESILRDAGLKGETVKDAQEFFELTDDELHAFTCDCGGYLDGRGMARRIREITSGGFAARFQQLLSG